MVEKEITSREALTDFKKRLEETGMWFSRVPLNTKREFKEYCKEEWADDRGLLFKYVWEEFKEFKELKKMLFKGECSSGHEEIHAKLDYLADELAKLKEVPKEEEPKKRKSLETKRLEKLEEIKNGNRKI